MLRRIPSELQKDALAVLRAEGLVAAARHVRGATGSALESAIAAVRDLALESGVVSPSTNEMSAEVIAVGPFRPALAEYLDYPRERYAGVPENTTVLTTVVDVFEDSAMCRELAACFGFDPWDFNSHALDASHVNVEVLKSLFDDDGYCAEKLVVLRNAGFRFYFNGPTVGSLS